VCFLAKLWVCEYIREKSKETKGLREEIIGTVKILITATHHVTRTGFVSSRHETSRHIVPLWFLVSRFVMHGFVPQKWAKKSVNITISDRKARIGDGININHINTLKI